MEAQIAITLSRAARLTRLLPLPGQDPTRVYGVVSDGLPQPPNGLGYVVEIVDFRTVRVRAWIRVGMSLWTCDAPLSEEPAREPDLTFLRDSASSSSGVVRLARSGAMDVARWDTSEREVRYALELSDRVIGPYAKPHPTLAVRTLAAVTWVALVEVCPAFVDAFAIADALTLLSREALPDALDLIMRHGKDSPGIALVAASLEEAGAGEVRRICAKHGAEGIYLHTTHLFWIRFDEEAISAEDSACLRAVEAAINRAILAIGWLLDQDLGAKALSPELWEEAERWAVLGVLAQAPLLFDTQGEGNPRRTIYGTTCERGGEWDLRTRIARMMEALRLPTRVPGGFDCDAKRGIVAFELAAPRARMLGKRDEGEEGARLRHLFAERVALLYCAMGFGASVGVTRVRVSFFDDTLHGEPFLGLDLARVDFAASVLPLLRRADDERASTDVNALIHELEGSGALRVGERALTFEALNLDARHGAHAIDERPLPQPLADFLRADVVRDLYVYGTANDPLIAEVTRILEENRDSALVAVMELEGLLSRIDHEEEGAREPLYCSSGTDRLVIALSESQPSTRYEPVRDVAYAAKLQLARLYLELGDAIRALEAAGECVRLAPTSPASHITLADIYARLDRYDEAATSLIRSLGFYLTPSEASYVFYRLAFALWKTGRTQAAEAAYTLAVDDPIVGNQAVLELAELRATCEFSGEYSKAAARVILETEGIPIPLSMRFLQTLAKAVVGLTDAGVFDPTWQGLRTLIPELGGDDLANLYHSLKDGVPRTA